MPTGAHERDSKGETLARERKVFFFKPYISKFISPLLVDIWI